MTEYSSDSAFDASHPHRMRAEDYYNTVHVDDYYDKVHRTTWSRRTAGFLGGATMGAVYGGIIGAIGAFLPHIFSTLGIAGAAAGIGIPALGVIGVAAAACAVVGVGFGMVILPDVAANSASISAGLEEFEKRHKTERMLDGSSVADSMTPVQKGDEPTSARIAPHTKLFSWKVAAITIPLFAAFGVMVALAGIAPPAAIMAGIWAHSTANVAVAATMFGMFGSLMAVKNSLISNKITNFYFKVLTEQYFEKHPAHHAQERQPTPDVAPELPAPAAEPELPARAKPFADSAKRASIADIMAARDKEDTNVANSLQR